MTLQRPSYAQDLVELAQQEVAAGRIGRRDFVRLMGALGLGAGAATLAGGSPAFADTKEITVANFGGDALAAWAKAWGDPFTKSTGIKVHFDGSGPLPSNIKQQVQANNVIWDVSDGDGYYGIQLGDAGFLDPIDYSIVDKSKVWPEFIWPYGVCDYVYSYVLAYDTTKVRGVPTWADFFDLKKYPGKRATWKYFMGTGEPILLADGVPPDKLYPMDMDRVIAKAKTLGDNLLLWDSGASSQQMFMDSEVTMACIWNTRASVLKRDTKGRVDYTFERIHRDRAGSAEPVAAAQADGQWSGEPGGVEDGDGRSGGDGPQQPCESQCADQPQRRVVREELRQCGRSMARRDVRLRGLMVGPMSVARALVARAYPQFFKRGWRPDGVGAPHRVDARHKAVHDDGVRVFWFFFAKKNAL
jgi:putative spermidine/putrescine transport system substrate-binding protein